VLVVIEVTEEWAVEWYPPPDSGQLLGRHMLLGLQHPPTGAGQLWGHHVSPWIRHPPLEVG
jgi:hypothetical protein